MNLHMNICWIDGFVWSGKNSDRYVGLFASHCSIAWACIHRPNRYDGPVRMGNIHALG